MINKFKVEGTPEIYNYPKLDSDIFVVPFEKKDSDFICVSDIYFPYMKNSRVFTSLDNYIIGTILKLASRPNRDKYSIMSDKNKTMIKDSIFTHFRNIIETDYNITEIIINNKKSGVRQSYNDIVSKVFSWDGEREYTIVTTRANNFLISDHFLASFEEVNGIITDFKPLLTLKVKKEYLNYFKSCVLIGSPNIRNEIFELWLSDDLFDPKYAVLKKKIKEQPIFNGITTVKKENMFNDLFKLIEFPVIKSLKEQKEFSSNIVSEFVKVSLENLELARASIHLIQ